MELAESAHCLEGPANGAPIIKLGRHLESSATNDSRAKIFYCRQQSGLKGNLNCIAGHRYQTLSLVFVRMIKDARLLESE